MDSKWRKELNALFENLASDLSDDLIRKGVKLIKTDDGRSDSITNEKNIVGYIYSILGKYNDVKMLPKADVRNWYDFGFLYKGKLIPVNLKMTANFGNDNVSSLKGIIWAFSNISDDVSGLVSWKDKKNAIETKIDSSFGRNRDYFFLIIDKKNLKDIFHTSIKQIKRINPNPNNLPFQANWNNNRILIDRLNVEAYKYTFEVFNESLKGLFKIANTLENYEDIIDKME